MSVKYSSSFAYSCISRDSFWESVGILLKKPHVVNKRLWGCNTLFNSNFQSLINNCNKEPCYERINNACDIEKYKDYIAQQVQTQESSTSLEVVLVELLPKTYSENHAFQLIILQKDNAVVTFYDVTPESIDQHLCPNFTFTISWNTDNIFLKAECDDTTKSYEWLKNTVLPQFVKWAKECPLNLEKHNICNESLNLVPSDKYYEKYNDLKLKHGKEMVKIWPECTDPAKFVYEDIAIAAYLLLLWEDENKNSEHKQTFVDLGCGNGLLVYILTKEGHCGIGIDVRKRQIWDMYTSDVKLQELTITPSDSHLFPETDWIIGNHSDELTPWIPVIAARSSYGCNFFLLPCCAYNFDGTKYQRRDSSMSQYTEYLQYIKQLCENCGFRTDRDRLKIPSTKRICLIGRGRNYSENEQDNYCNIIQDIISTEKSCTQNESDTSWIQNFKPRDPIERVRNCTKVDKTLIESIVHSISNHLLEQCDFESYWCPGNTVEINELVKLIPQDELKSLKSECGGLQTLLKNNHHIFKVQSGKVQLRYPKTIEEVTKGFKSRRNTTNILKIRQKPCWFYKNHPQGCPLSDDNCSFLHTNPY